MKIGKGSCNGTFGELAQGNLGGRPFLITFPISELYSFATFKLRPMDKAITGPKNKSKAIDACKKLLEVFRIKTGGHLEIFSNIPPGKGLASSSADMVASIRAVADSLSLILTEELVSKICAEIEPTDGVMYEDVVAYDFINGQLIETFGTLPPFGIIGIDFGGSIDTIQFNRKFKRGYSTGDELALIQAYELIKKGMKEKNVSVIGKGSTISAELNQRILPKPYFAELKSISEQFKGGIVAAHSGTVLGIVYDPTKQNQNELFNEVTKIIDREAVSFCFMSSQKEKASRT